MQIKKNRALIVLNVALLGVLTTVTLAPMADAQNAVNRGRGEYTLVAGELDSTPAEAVYVIDSANAEMIVLRWNLSRKGLDGVGYRNLQEDSKAPIRR